MNRQTKELKHKITAVLTAFALAVTLLPTGIALAADENTEPTQTASEMAGGEGGSGSEGTDDEQTGDGVTDPTEDSSSLNDSETGTETDIISEETSSSTETTTTTAPSVTTTTIDTSRKGWKTPKGNKALSLTICRNTDGTVFDLMTQAGQKLYEYDTLQGATAGKGYGYFTLYNRKVNKVKIVKVQLSTMKVVKVSAAMDLKHGNEIAYNPRKNILVVANADPTPKRISVVNASTLKLLYHKNIKMPRKISGLSKKQCKKFKGIGAIAYNEKHNCYVCRTRKKNDLLLLNANFKPYKNIKQKSKVSGMVYQGLDTYKDCIMVCQSFKGKKHKNIITVYNMKGKKLARFTMAPGSPALELETVFHNGNQFYAGFYTSYGAKADLQKLKIKRDNFIYRINNL